MNSEDRFIWHETHVVDVRDSAFASRLYREQRDVRSFLAFISDWKRLRLGCEIGSGYGRMTAVLCKFCEQVIGFEREVHFVHTSRILVPTAHFLPIESLSEVPSEAEAFDFVLTFTVLQHLNHLLLDRVSLEIGRILAHDGFLLICEETDPAVVTGFPNDPQAYCTIGRSVDTYAKLFETLDLLLTCPRRIERNSPRNSAGTYMLFRKSTGKKSDMPTGTPSVEPSPGVKQSPACTDFDVL